MIGSYAARNWSWTTLLVLAVTGAILTNGAGTRSPASAQSADTNPALAHLEIDIWPEFDRPSAALVILRAEIATDVTLPASVSLRIPAASGGPAAVATAASAEARLLTLPYERSDVQLDFMTISFVASDRFLHVEFYDPITATAENRQYSYIWSGDFVVAQTTVQLQEPALSSAVTITPDLGAAVERADALFYREADVGPLEAGQSLNVDVQYTKSDARTSAEILGLELGNPEGTSDDNSDGVSVELLILIGAGAVVVLVIAAAFVWQRRGAAAAASLPANRPQRRRLAAEGSGPHCRQCGSLLAADDRFCASCGTAVKSGH